MIREGYVVYTDYSESSFQLMYTGSVGGCGKGCSSCSSATDGCDIKSYGPFVFDKKNYDIKNGSSVEVEVYPRTHLIPALIILILPLMEFFFAYWGFTQFSIIVATIITLILTAIYFITLVIFNKKWKRIVKGEVIKVKG